MANVVFMDGFDMYDGANNNTVRPGLHSKWIIANSNSLYFSPGRYGGQCIHFGAEIFSNNIKGYFNENLFLQSSTLAFAFITDNVANMGNNGRFFTLLHNDSDQFGLGVSNIGQILLYRGNNVVAITSPNLIRTNDWHYMEMEYVGHASAGRATLYLDGIKVVEFTGNTQNQAPYGFNGIQMTGGNAASYWLDDLYVLDQATRIGERRIETLRPNGDVSGNQFTPATSGTSFSQLNETLVSADNYVTSNLQGATDLYNFSNLTTAPNKIDAIQLSVWASKTDAETRQMSTQVKSGSVTTNSKDYNLPTNHLDMNRIENVDPATGAAWTTSGVNAVQAGFKITK